MSGEHDDADPGEPVADQPQDEVSTADGPTDVAADDPADGAGASATFEAEEPAGPVWIPAESGACPICEEQFDDAISYRAHLAAMHDLHDDDGTATAFHVLVVPGPPPEEAHRGPVLPGMDRPERSKEAPTMERPVGLGVLVGFLLLVFFGLVTLTSGGGDDKDDDEVVLAESDPTDDGRVTSDAKGTDGTAAPADAPKASEGGTAAPLATQPAPPPAPTTTVAPPPPPAPTTTVAPPPPPPTFSAPTATSASILSCERDKNTWRVVYRWKFSGGSLWKPLAAYTPAGGGRYKHTIVVPRRDDVTINLVYVLDPDGVEHAVSLKPALNTATC